MSIQIGTGTICCPVTANDDRINPDCYKAANYCGTRYSEMLWPSSMFFGPVGNVSDWCWEWTKVAKGVHARLLISGTTKDATGNPLGGVTVDLYDAPTKTLVDTVTSDAGGYYVTGTPYSTAVFANAYLTGSPDVAGTTVDLFVGDPGSNISGNNVSFVGSPHYWAFNNVWGIGSLVNGTDFTQTMAFHFPEYPGVTTITWNWPASPGGIYGYPEVIYGTHQSQATPAGVTLPTTKQLSAFTTLTVAFNYSLTGSTNDSVIFDLWLRSSSTSPTQANLLYELDVSLYTAFDSGRYAISYTSSSPITADVRAITNWNGAATWTWIGVAPYTAMTNLFPNSAMAGGSAGTPGTPPTNVSVTGAYGGLTQQIVGFGTTTAADGTSVNYMDIRWSGTTNLVGTWRIKVRDTTLTTASPGDVWEGEVYAALVAGSWANVTSTIWTAGYYDSSSSFISSGGGGALTTDNTTTTGPSANLLKYRSISTAPANTAHMLYELDIAAGSGVAIDFTLRLAAPKYGIHIPATITNSTMDFKALFADLISHGIITGNEYLGGIEFGAESSSGAGGLQITSYTVVWK